MARLILAVQQVVLADYLERPEGGDRAVLLDRLETYLKRSFVRPEALAARVARAAERNQAVSSG
jgi:hypothetical protein